MAGRPFDSFGQQDLNLGLVSLCEDSLRRRQIQNLTETYLTLSLGAICSHVGMDAAAEKDLKEVETEIGEMVSSLEGSIFRQFALLPAPRRIDGPQFRVLTILCTSSQISNRQIYATLTAPAEPSSSSARAETIVTFSDDPESYLSHETVARVTRAIENAQQLEKKWGYEADRLEASREFVQKVRVLSPASSLRRGLKLTLVYTGVSGLVYSGYWTCERSRRRCRRRWGFRRLPRDGGRAARFPGRHRLRLVLSPRWW